MFRRPTRSRKNHLFLNDMSDQPLNIRSARADDASIIADFNIRMAMETEKETVSGLALAKSRTGLAAMRCCAAQR